MWGNGTEAYGTEKKHMREVCRTVQSKSQRNEKKEKNRRE
jgi:hypothetical protein